MNNNRKLIGAVLISVASFLSFYFVLQNYNHITQLKTAVAERETLLASRTKIINDILELKKDYQSKKAEIEKISAAIPSKKGLPEIITAFEFMSSSTGLSLTTLNVAENPSSEDPFNTLRIENKLSGGYESFRNFLSSVESSRRLVDIYMARLNLEATGVLLIAISGQAYVLK